MSRRSKPPELECAAAKPVSTVNPYPRSGPARGLIARVRLEDIHLRGRELVRGVPVVYSSVKRSRSCIWCFQPLDGAARRWHPECVRWYLVARGQVVQAGGGRYLIDPGPCDRCGKDPIEEDGLNDIGERRDPQHLMRIYGFEVDHRLALSIARANRDDGDPDWWRAWTPGNLRWLCHECHGEKTRDDRRDLAAKRRRQTTGVEQQRLPLVEDHPMTP